MDTLLQKECPIDGKWDGQPTNEKMIRIKAAQLMGAMDDQIEQAAREFCEWVMRPIAPQYGTYEDIIADD